MGWLRFRLLLVVVTLAITPQVTLAEGWVLAVSPGSEVPWDYGLCLTKEIVLQVGLYCLMALLLVVGVRRFGPRVWRKRVYLKVVTIGAVIVVLLWQLPFLTLLRFIGGNNCNYFGYGGLFAKERELRNEALACRFSAGTPFAEDGGWYPRISCQRGSDEQWLDSVEKRLASDQNWYFFLDDISRSPSPRATARLIEVAGEDQSHGLYAARLILDRLPILSLNEAEELAAVKDKAMSKLDRREMRRGILIRTAWNKELKEKALELADLLLARTDGERSELYGRALKEKLGQ